ncbi:MAG TPA: hypothetical protein VNI83_13020 [Vicinamibacterales bacterium]|nr:hypothetical protein [Vicinamibacterales bacterium]
MRAAFLLLIGLLAAPAVAAADQLEMRLSGGRVTIIADNVPLQRILAEWARLGQTKIINAEKLTGPPVTLRLLDVPESQALEVLLRSASGYIAAPRPQPAPSASTFDRVVILASSRPVNTPVPVQPGLPGGPAGAYAPPGAMPPPGAAPPMVVPDDEQGGDVDPSMRPMPQWPVTSPQPGPVMTPPPGPGMAPSPFAPPGSLTPAPQPGSVPPGTLPPGQQPVTPGMMPVQPGPTVLPRPGVAQPQQPPPPPIRPPGD